MSRLFNNGIVGSAPGVFGGIAPDGSIVGTAPGVFGGAARNGGIVGSANPTNSRRSNGFLSNGIQSFVDNQIQQAFASQFANATNNFPFNGIDYNQQTSSPNFILPAIEATTKPSRPSINTIQKNCGRSKFSSPFIIGGEEAQKGEWPWFGSLFVSVGESIKNLKLLCGVSLLSSKHVVTAAHCIELPNEPHRYSVMLGRHNIADPRETGYQSRQITRLAIHPEYKNRQQRADADIAILKLKQAVEFNNFVQTVCLPQASIDYNNVKGVVVGYGKSESYLDHTTIPRKISVNAANLVTCLYSDPAYVQIASKRNFCAAGAGKSPCKGKKVKFALQILIKFF